MNERAKNIGLSHGRAIRDHSLTDGRLARVANVRACHARADRHELRDSRVSSTKVAQKELEHPTAGVGVRRP